MDNNVEKYWVIEQTYIPTSQVFDNPESAICVTVGHTLSAGKYYVYTHMKVLSVLYFSSGTDSILYY